MSDPTMQGTPPGATAPRWSLAEIDAQCRKAARGLGCPWGMAEEAGKAARQLAAHGLPGPEALATMLGARTACCCTSGARCDLRIGVEAADQGTRPGEGASILTRAIAGDYALPGAPGSRAVAPEAWAILDRLAARTYAPASEASRRSGAGAGTTDND